MSEINAEMVDAALKAWFASPPSESDMGLERSMRAALIAALAERPDREGLIEQLREALEQMTIWMPSGFAPQSQERAMGLAYRALEAVKRDRNP